MVKSSSHPEPHKRKGSLFWQEKMPQTQNKLYLTPPADTYFLKSIQNNKYIEQIKNLWTNWQTPQNDFRTISEWWEEGKKHIKAFTKLFTRASTTEQESKKRN